MVRDTVDVLILGAGIAGLLLARELRQRGVRVAIAHDPARAGASEAAVGLLNPVRGRRCTLAWRAAEAFAAAHETYAAIGREAGRPHFRPLPVVRAFASAEERSHLERRTPAIAAAGFDVRELPESPAGFRDAGHGAVAIDGGGAVAVHELLEHLRADLRAAGMLIERPCPAGGLAAAPGSIAWTAASLSAGRVVLAGGAHDLASSLAPVSPLRPVAGESLLVRAPALEPGAAFVCGHHLSPVAPGVWSCGGTKTPGSALAAPTAAGRAELEAFLRNHVAAPWEVIDHRGGVRAATLDTRPVVGCAGGDPRMLLCNGLGSQGFSVAPWLAGVFADHLVSGTALPPEVDPARFAPRPAPPAGLRWHAVDVAHAILRRHLAPGDRAIDLTVGNGGDTLRLAEAVGPDGAVLGVDIQPEAIAAARRRLDRDAPDADLDLRCADHARIDSIVPPDWRGRVGAVVANLGHLPGFASPLATRPESTITAVSASLPLLRPGGVLVAVVYAGHRGGAEELAALERWTAGLDPRHHRAAWEHAPGRPAGGPVVVSVACEPHE